MKESKVKILMVDDHQAILMGYHNILEMNADGVKVESIFCKSITDSIDFIDNDFIFDTIDYFFIDFFLPPHEPLNLNTGQDLAKYILKKNKKAKIIILTGLTQPLKLMSLMDEVDPIGILVKSEVDVDTLLDAFENFLNKKPYYSPSVEKAKKIFRGLKFKLDSIDFKIIDLISQGVKTSNMPKILPLTRDGINKRKSKIKMHFDIEDGDDEVILRTAKTLGLFD
jgi:two-component system response regulator NreC